MTAHPILANYGMWWLVPRASWRRLHAVPEASLTPERLHDAIDWGGPLNLRTACGLVVDLTYAGIGSRFGMSRCAHCCRAIGIPSGSGTPVNEAARTRGEDL